MANFGMYHPTYNPNGSKKASDDKYWYETSVSFTSISDCFNPDKLLANSGTIASGKNGRPDGLFYDQVHEGDITDLRNSSKKVEDYNRLINREFNKLVAGTTRGKESEIKTESFIAFTSLTTNLVQINNNVGFQLYDKIVLHDSGNNAVYQGYITNVGTSVVTVSFTYNRTAGSNYTYIKRSGVTKSNTLLHCDIIGNPTNYPTAWKQSGVFGTPLIIAEDGTSLLPDGTQKTIKLSRKVNGSLLLSLKSTDGGITWVSGLSTNFNSTNNTITRTFETNAVELYFYRTKTLMAVPTVNSEVVEIGDVEVSNSTNNGYAMQLVSSMIGKIPTNTISVFNRSCKIKNFTYNRSSRILESSSQYMPEHESLQGIAQTTSPTCKAFPYLTRTNGKAYLNIVFKEMKHNGTSWGDDNKFNIVDNVSTTTDNNAQTVLVGQKTVELPYFIGADE